jgi:tripartite-type tricarboxylate transporter receptor subunit TctC
MSTSMTSRRSTRLAGAAAIAALTLSACGGNIGSGGNEESYPNGPVTLTVGQAPGGSTDLIARALAEGASETLGASIPVVNKPGANGALAAKEFAGMAADGQNLMLLNASLITVTSLTVPESEAVTLDDFEIVTGISQDDYVLVANSSSSWKTVDDLKAAGTNFDYATTGIGTGSQLAQALLFEQAGLKGTSVPFDGGSPAMTALLGNQVDLAVIQLGEAMPQIEAGGLTPIVTFSEERNQNLPDTPTAVEAGYDVPVSQYRAVAAPKGTPQSVMQKLRESFQAAFDSEKYKNFNKENMLTAKEIDGAQVREAWNGYAEKYRKLTQQYGIDLGGSQ